MATIGSTLLMAVIPNGSPHINRFCHETYLPTPLAGRWVYSFGLLACAVRRTLNLGGYKYDYKVINQVTLRAKDAEKAFPSSVFYPPIWNVLNFGRLDERETMFTRSRSQSNGKLEMTNTVHEETGTRGVHGRKNPARLARVESRQTSTRSFLSSTRN